LNLIAGRAFQAIASPFQQIDGRQIPKLQKSLFTEADEMKEEREEAEAGQEQREG
jgi:hypothetical protein